MMLIDSGPSERGWSFYASYFRCLKLGAILRLGILDDSSDARTRGTLGHIGLGHLHIRWMLQQQGGDPGMYYPPDVAMAVWSEQHTEGTPHLQQMQEVIRRYAAKFTAPPGRILGVETTMKGVLGMRGDTFGLWLLANPESLDSTWRADAAPTPLAHDGHPIQPSTLPSGAPIYITRKLDLVYEEGRGLVCIRDFKCTAGDVSEGKARGYMMDGQFAVTRILAGQKWGSRFGGNTLQFIKTTDPFTVKSHTVPATPWRDALFARQLYSKAHEIAHHEAHTPIHEWPMAQHEQVCKGRYEKDGCVATGFCADGPAWRPM